MRIDRLVRRLATGVALLASTSFVLVANAQAPTTQELSVRAEVAQQSSDIDWTAVQQALGKSGTMMPGNVFRIGMPRSDLNVMVEGVPVKANFALGSYAAFRPLDDGSGQTMVMGDLVLRDEEVPGVMSGLFDNGLQATALHNHLNQVTPHVMYMHYEGMGDPIHLATSLHAALSASGTPLGPVAPAPAYTGPQLDRDALQSILGRAGTQGDNGVVQFSIPRAESITEDGMPLPPAMGTAIGINFQPTDGGKAAITGDFVLVAEEVNPVASTLRANGIEVTALHNHALGDQPRLIYMHFWANDDPSKLATGLRAALDQINTAPAS
jgi:hypothetical protein